MRKHVWLASAALAVWAPVAAWAETAPEAPEPDVASAAGARGVAEVVVTATRTAQPAERIGASVTVLTSDAIERSQAAAVVELLAQTPGVSFTRNGGPGAATSLNIRGAENQHAVVLIDGVKLNDPSSTQGGFNSGNLLTGDIARIEVLRGAQSTLWGSQAIGGVVNIVTREPETPFEAGFDFETGARRTAYLRAGAGGATERVVWRAAGGYYSTGGFSAYRFGREPDGYRNTGASGRLRVILTEQVSADLRAVYSRGRNEFDAVGADSPEYGRTEELVAYAGLNVALFDGRLKNRFGHAVTDTDRENHNPARPAQPLTFDAAGKNRRFEYQGVLAITERITATFGAESEAARMRTRSPTVATPNPAFVRGEVGVDSVYGQVQAALLEGLTLTGGVRRDWHDAYGGHTVGQAAAAWALDGGRTVLRASWGKGFRAPGVFELFSEFGDLGLAPESFDSWDAGIEQQLWDGRARLSATWFHRDGDNEIRFNGCVAASTDPLCRVAGRLRSGYYRNVLKTRARGIELLGRVKPFSGLEVTANYTWTDAQTASGPHAGKQLTRRPEHLWNLQAAYEWPIGLSTAAAVRHAGKSYNNDANTVVVAGYTVVDLRASYPLSRQLEGFARVENLFDERYETVLNYGAPRRGAFMGLRARF